MFGLTNRGQLPQVVEDELENQMARIRALWLEEHHEDGTHRTELLGLAAEEHEHDAADITSGTLALGRIPSLPASQITSGTLDVARIPDLSANKITSDTLADARIPDLAASKITSGAFTKAVQHAETAYLDDAQTFSLKQTLSVAPELTLGFTERGRSVAAGEWIAPSYSAGDFSASAGTWTVDSGDVITYRYTLVGKTMTVSFVLAPTALSGSTATTLTVAIPGGHTANVRMDNSLANATEAGTAVAAFCYVTASGTVINIEKASGAAWGIAAINVTGQITFEVQ